MHGGWVRAASTAAALTISTLGFAPYVTRALNRSV
jgi:hypothetical protein